MYIFIYDVTVIHNVLKTIGKVCGKAIVVALKVLDIILDVIERLNFLVSLQNFNANRREANVLLIVMEPSDLAVCVVEVVEVTIRTNGCMSSSDVVPNNFEGTGEVEMEVVLP